MAACFGPGGRVCSGSDDRSARMWDAAGACTCILSGHVQGVSSVAFSVDGTKVASGSYDGTIRLYDAQTGLHLRVLTVASDGPANASPSAEAALKAEAAAGAALKVYAGYLFPKSTKGLGISALAFHRSGKFLLSATLGATIQAWDLDKEGGTLASTLRGHEGAVMALACADGAILASGGTDDLVSCWQAAFVLAEAF